MKKIIVLLGFSLFAFTGYASAAGCHYSLDGEHAKASPIVEGEIPTDPTLLALLKKQQADELATDAQKPLFN